MCIFLKACNCFFIFYFYEVLLSSKEFSGFVASLSKAVVRFLPVPNCELLAFYKSLSMLKNTVSFNPIFANNFLFVTTLSCIDQNALSMTQSLTINSAFELNILCIDL